MSATNALRNCTGGRSPVRPYPPFALGVNQTKKHINRTLSKNLNLIVSSRWEIKQRRIKYGTNTENDSVIREVAGDALDCQSFCVL